MHGRVIDSTTSEPVPYATVSLKPLNQPELKQIASDKGAFVFSVPVAQGYILIISSIGYKLKSITLSNIDSLKIDSLKLSPSQNSLKEITIKSFKPLVTQDVDRISYDIQNDIDSKSFSTIEIMKKVPLLTVDADNHIRVKGQLNFKILVDGQPSSIMDLKASDILKNMPASGIEKIEVITVPPSKYESEGLAGIINIIMKKSHVDLYNGSLNASTYLLSDQSSSSGSGTFSFKEKKFGMSANFGAAVYKPREIINLNRSDLYDNADNLNQLLENNFTSKYQYLSANLNYEIDSLNLITGQISLYGTNNSVPGTNATSMFNNGLLIQSFQSQKIAKDNNHINTYSVNYERGFKRSKQQILELSYKYNIYPLTASADVNFLQQFNSQQVNFSAFNNATATEQTFQVYYTFPIKKVLIDLGSKMIFRTNESDYNSFEAGQTGTSNSNFYNTQDVFSVFNSYSFKLGKSSVRAGLRLENTAINSKTSDSTNNVKLNFLNLSPAIAIQRPLSNTENLNFGYTQRVSRPSITDLNTFVDKTNPLVQKTGNTSLTPSVGNNFQISYSKFDKNNLIIGLTYSFQKNVIQSIASFDPGTNTTYISYSNIGQDNSFGINIYYKYNFSNSFSMDLNSNSSQIWLKGVVSNTILLHSGFNEYLNSSLSYKFKGGFRINGSVGYEKPAITLQQTQNHNISSSAGATKELSKQNLVFSLSANNPFSRYRVISRTLLGSNFIQSQNTQLYYRYFQANLAWRFGALKNQIRSSRKTINNDDLN